VVSESGEAGAYRDVDRKDRRWPTLEAFGALDCRIHSPAC
jgi:hypothetical protein